ncbi:hypothetical protein V5799_024147 [Amblyomma americanum]|uniref:Uncharacterized protein n=1 Tax=Amblyomma americanum TaxID=6943 RepID=A0AAQ4ECV7_AMBAM
MLGRFPDSLLGGDRPDHNGSSAVCFVTCLWDKRALDDLCHRTGGRQQRQVEAWTMRFPVRSGRFRSLKPVTGTVHGHSAASKKGPQLAASNPKDGPRVGTRAPPQAEATSPIVTKHRLRPPRQGSDDVERRRQQGRGAVAVARNAGGATHAP